MLNHTDAHTKRNHINILLVDDHPIVRFGFIALLTQPHATFTFFEADTAQTALQLTAGNDIDVTLLDLSLAGTLRMDLIRQLHQLSPRTAILVVSMHDENLYAERALKAGARGYVMKQVAAKAIVEAIQCVQDGRIWLSEALRLALHNRITDSRTTGGADGFHALSDRELAVFQLIGQGLKKGEIAHVLKLSPNTVETYRSNIKNKMGIATGAALYRIAFIHCQALTL